MTACHRVVLLFLLTVTLNVGAAVSGHLKYRYTGVTVAENSALRVRFGDEIGDHSANLRLNGAFQRQQWSARLDYDMSALHGDRARIFDDADERRLWDLSGRLDSGEESLWRHRLDRAWLAYTSANWVVRAGRQALSWGNGLIYNPLDFLNPFDPTAIDTEYKSGSEMLYLQYLRANGDDVQAVWSGRRDERGKSAAAQNSVALKYHALRGESEFDFLLARHVAATMAGVGYSRGLGAALLRSDVVLRDTDEGRYVSAVSNLSMSWTAAGYVMSGVLEWYYQRVGLRGDGIDQQTLSGHPELQRQLSAGEVFTSGRQYLALALDTELHPLLMWGNSLFHNLSDGSALWQSVLRWDMAEDWQVTGAVSVPAGPVGSEFRGRKPAPDQPAATTDGVVFFQLARYF